jgi:apolipoprotein N-acyltransferase
MRLPRALLVIVSAALYALAFPPVAWTPLAWIALAPLFVALHGVGAARGAALGLGWGLATALGLCWTLPGAIARYFDVGPLAGWAGLAAVGVASGAPFALYGAWAAWTGRAGAPIAVALGWGATELLRTRAVGPAWGLVAYSQTDLVALVQVADVAGPYGVGMLVVAVNAVVAAVWLGRRVAWSAAVVAAALLAAVAYGEWRVRLAPPAGVPIAVALVQPGAAEVDEAAWLAMTNEASAGRPRLVLWSENAVAVALEDEAATRMRVSRAATGADVLLGGPSHVWGRDGVRRHNSVFLLRDGGVAGRYDKRRLLPFAEADYAPGGRSRLLRTVAGRVGALVCFEAMYPELARALSAGGAEVLANLANDAWLRYPAVAEHHLRIAALRAVENRRWVLRAAKTGVSALIDPYGRVVARQAFGEAGVVAASIVPSRVVTPYQRLGDAPLAVAAGLGLLLSIASRRRRT